MSTGKKIRAMLATLMGTGMIAFSAHAKNSLFIVINDHLGTPQMLIDEHKNIVWHAEYDEFGKADILVEKTEFNLRFPGQYYDKETGLHYNYYRDYDPSIGRYVQSDPIGLRGGVNTYAYALGNPVRYIDPLGLEVTYTCRPVQTAQNLGITRPTHCSVIIWHWEESCEVGGERRKVIDNQFSLERDGLRPSDTDTNSDTFTQDTDAFFNGGDGVTNTEIPLPPIFPNQQAFDETVTNNGNNASNDSYNPYFGPNSNSTANGIIESSGGNVPSWPTTGAWPGF